MRAPITGCLLLIATVVFPSARQSPFHSNALPAQLPSDAVVLETQHVPFQRHPNRGLALWMSNPTKHPDTTEPGFPYTCPEQTRGSYFHGRVHVSLIDLVHQRIINTVEIKGGDKDGTLDVPYKIRRGYYYWVGGGDERERKPKIMRLLDYNGDGAALEFALFNADDCSTLGTTLVGYSERQDRVLQYPIDLVVQEGTTRTARTTYWADQLFKRKPIRPGHWKYMLEYPGSELHYEYKIEYDRRSERFTGTETLTPIAR